MKSKTRKELQELNIRLASNSWPVYRKLLGRIVAGLDADVFPDKDKLMGAIRNQNVDLLLDLADSLVSQKHDTATKHFVANQIAYLIKKYPFPKTLGSFDPESKAREKFFEAEQKCKATNERLVGPCRPWDSHLHSMTSFIGYVLGGDLEYSTWWEYCDFGPGAAVGVSGNASNVKRKIASRWTVTPSALIDGFAAFSQNWSLLDCINSSEIDRPICLDGETLFREFVGHCDVISYNKIAFVPKTTRVHRTIAAEPLVNGFLQKGIDKPMRHRLRRVGIDLSEGQTINSRMALLGSLDDSLDGFVTIDLSSASDCIATELVRSVIPLDWFLKMDATRSKHYLLDGEIKPYEKFCSMGNGFSFPLESLLFAAAAHACGCGRPGVDFHVYGDDIIVRKRYARELLDLLEFLGFSANPDKTFIEGPFRESCGTDWFEGKDVRPFILDFALDSVEAVFKFLNLSRRSATTTAFFQDIRAFVIALLPFEWQLLRPYPGPEDTAIDSELDEFMSSKYAEWYQPLQCWRWRELLRRPVNDSESMRREHFALMIAAVRGASASEPFVFRRKTRTALRWVAYG